MPKNKNNKPQRRTELARSYATEAIDMLVVLICSGKDEGVCGKAAQALLDRGLGQA